MEFIAINVVSGPITCDMPLPSVTISCVWANATIGEVVTVDAIVSASSDANGSWFISTAYLDDAGGGGSDSTSIGSAHSAVDLIHHHSFGSHQPGPVDARDPTGTGVNAAAAALPATR